MVSNNKNDHSLTVVPGGGTFMFRLIDDNRRDGFYYYRPYLNAT